MGYMPCQLHWRLPGKDCRGRREDTANLTPAAGVVVVVVVIVVVETWRLGPLEKDFPRKR